MKVFPNLHALVLVCVSAASFSSRAGSATIVTANNGMTLYVFGRDANGVPSCYYSCSKQWSPYLVKDDNKKGVGWGTVKRNDGSMQWTYHNRPVCFYADDKKAVDANGDRVGRVWHAVRH
jgi:predicted lipoprotein with Yx(FWY)xxD motif